MEVKMKNFTFYNPTKVIFGKDTISKIGAEIASAGIKNVLLLAGGGSIKKNGVYDAVVNSLQTNNIKWREHFGVRPNPEVMHAREAKVLIKENNLEAVLAVGGGSVIDEAKAICSGYYLDDIYDEYIGKATPSKGLPLYTVLTLSGTGSEMNMGSVLSNDELGLKLGFFSAFHFPKVSIIDPSVQASLPQNQTVNGGIDAITHCMENYFVGTTQEVTTELCLGLMRTLLKCIDILVVTPEDYDARASLAWASTLALNQLTAAGMNGGDWTTHRLQHGISALYPRVAHAEGLAAVFPSWLRYTYDANELQFKRWAKEVWDGDSVEEGVQNMVKKFRSWGQPTCIKELNVPRERIPDIVDTVVKFAPTLGQVKILKADDYRKIYENAYEM